MGTRMSGGLLVAVMLLAGCASGEEWREWRSHGAHFASGDHMAFSLRNRESGASGVTRTDLARAGEQAWWGKAITVDQGQILER